MSWLQLIQRLPSSSLLQQAIAAVGVSYSSVLLMGKPKLEKSKLRFLVKKSNRTKPSTGTKIHSDQVLIKTAYIMW